MSHSIAQNIKSQLWEIPHSSQTPWLFSLDRVRSDSPRSAANSSARCAKIRPIFSSHTAAPVVAALPTALSGLTVAIEKSRWMLDLPDNWDEAGASAYELQTWQRAVDFLCLSATTLWGDTGIVVSAPQIQNGPEGTIDLFWESDEATLLINVPVNASEPAMFYGSNRRGDETRGTIQITHANSSLLLWAKG